MIHKACPVVLHPDGDPRRHLLLHHPVAGTQLLKGTVKPGEDPARAALRELLEESGLETRSAIPLGLSTDIAPNETWHFTLCRIPAPARARWQHAAADDGGHLFQFSWHILGSPTPPMHVKYQNALNWICDHLS